MARTLTDHGVEFLVRQLSAAPGLFDCMIGLHETSAGIGGSRQALAILGVRPAWYSAAVPDQATAATLQHQFPEVHLLRDAEKLEVGDFLELSSGAHSVSLVLHCASMGAMKHGGLEEGLPSSGVRAAMKFASEVRRITRCLQEAFSTATVKEILEGSSRASRDEVDALSSALRSVPVETEAADLTCQRRNRLYWIQWPVFKRGQVSAVRNSCRVSVKVKLKPRAILADAIWIKSGWRRHPKLRRYPALTKPRATGRSGFQGTGVRKASWFAKRSWRADAHRLPPIHYEKEMQVQHKVSKAWRYLDVSEYERLLGYDTDHTYWCFNSKRRRQHPVEWRAARGRLLGGSLNCLVVAWIIAELLWSVGWLVQPLDLNELVRLRVRLLPTEQSSPFVSLEPQIAGDTEQERILRLIRWLMGRQTARGGEIRTLTGFNEAKRGWQEVRADWFQWRSEISTPWAQAMHINLAEAYGRLLGVKWRSQRAAEHGVRYLNLVDSQVNLGHAARGRGGSHRMRHVELQISAHQVAAHLREISGYVRSDKNPADRGSRDVEAWRRRRGDDAAPGAQVRQGP